MLDEVPSGWEKAALGNCAKLERGKFSARPRNDPKFYGGHMPFLQTGDIARTDRYISKYSQTLNHLGVGVSRTFPTGTTVMAIAANVGDVAISTFEAAYPDSVVGIFPADGVDNEWLYHCLRHHKSEFSDLATSNAQANLSLAKLEPFSITLPSLIEQQRIAEILTSVDDTIRATEAVIAQTERVKLGVMEDLLTGGLGSEAIANGEVPDGWETHQFGELIELVSGQHIDADEVNENGEGCPYLTGPADFPNGQIVVTKHTKNPKKMCSAGDILVTVKGSGAGKSIVSDAEYCISRQLMAVRAISCRSGWAAYSLKLFQLDMQRQAAGLIPGISRTDILNRKLAVPTLQQQDKIAQTLNSIDDDITVKKALLSRAKRLKQGLMSDLLTGKKRVV